MDCRPPVHAGTESGLKSTRPLAPGGCSSSSPTRVRHTLKADMGQPSSLRRETLTAAGETVDAVVLNMGNPQCVVLGPATESRLHTIGAALAIHPAFPAGTNVELATVETPGSRSHPDLGARRRPDRVVGDRLVRGRCRRGLCGRRLAFGRGRRSRRRSARRVDRRGRLADGLGGTHRRPSSWHAP